MRLRSAAQSGVKPGERPLTVSNLRLAAPTQREHHRLVVAWTNTGPGPGSSLLSIRADTRLTDVEACRRRIIIDLPGSSRSDLPSQFWDRNNRSSPDSIRKTCPAIIPSKGRGLSSRIFPRRLRICARKGMVPVVLYIQLSRCARPSEKSLSYIKDKNGGDISGGQEKFSIFFLSCHKARLIESLMDCVLTPSAIAISV